MDKLIVLSLILCLNLGCILCSSEPNAYDPEIISKKTNSRGKPLFRGTIGEDELKVSLTPKLRAVDKDEVGGARLICGYRIITRKHNIPFVIEVKNRLTGEADIKVAEGKKLSYNKRKHYRFKIIAYDCSSVSRESESAIVKIKVNEAEEAQLKFEKEEYMVNAEEGKLYDSLLILSAGNKDKICGYEIKTTDVPFEITDSGNLYNTEPLDYSVRRNYILHVVASDCSEKTSEPVNINIEVKQMCRNGWRDIPSYLDYPPGSGQQKLMSEASLSLCDDTCQADKILVHMILHTRHIGKGCDRDTYSITSQRKICGASPDNIDLLPTPDLVTKWTKNLPSDDGSESDKIFAFDGTKTAVDVPEEYFEHTLEQHFTIATWMKHNYPEEEINYEEDAQVKKEHIMCMSDGTGMNRHHYSLFVHGEKLVFLLRKEADLGDEVETFKPAEWRWHIPQINDNEWHHYAISMDFPEVRLYIDGKMLLPDRDNLEIADDLSLHPTQKVDGTRLVVGACWQGKEQTYKHHLKGYLAGLSVLNGKTESDRVIKCLNNCKENLDFLALSEMQSGTTVSFNSEMTEFTITGQNASEVQNLVREVTYVNSRTYPTPGRRNVNIETTVQCGEKYVSLPEASTYVIVHHSSHPVIYINGRKSVVASFHELRGGVKIFEDVTVTAAQSLDGNKIDLQNIHELTGEDEQSLLRLKKEKYLEYKLKKEKNQQNTIKEDLTDDLFIDTCTVRADPPLDLRYEKLTLPKRLMKQFGISMEDSETNAGLVVRNADKITNYRMVLRGLHYYHFQAETLEAREFVLSCSSQNGRFISNEHRIKVLPKHEEPKTEFVAHAQVGSNKAAVVQEEHILKRVDDHKSDVGSVPHFGMAAIIVVCVGFLLFMIVLGVIRIRAAQRRTQVVQVKEEEEMEWDNSGLNITVNPMEQEIFDYEENAAPVVHGDSDTDDDISDFPDDDDSTDEEHELKKDQELEWDNSTLSI